MRCPNCQVDAPLICGLCHNEVEPQATYDEDALRERIHDLLPNALHRAATGMWSSGPAIALILDCVRQSVDLKPRPALPPDVRRAARDALAWALDLMDRYDERLAAIDGPELVYSATHLAGKRKARRALAYLIAPWLAQQEGTSG